MLSRRDEAARAARRERDQAIHEAACFGLSLSEIAEAAGITKQAAHQVVQAAGGSRQAPRSRAGG
jgi:AcrR family transcriptional regulator